MLEQFKFSIYLTNLSEYNKGVIKAEWLDLPCTKLEFYTKLNTIGIEDYNKDEWFITDIDIDIECSWDFIKEYSDIEQLNYLAALLEDLDKDEIKKLEAVLDMESISDINELINLIFNLDNYEFYPSIKNERDLGYYLIYESGMYDIPELEEFKYYIDYDMFGRDYYMACCNKDFTSYGYVYCNSDIEEIYDGDVPEEYKIY